MTYGRVPDLRLRGSWFKSHGRHCIVLLGMTLYPQLTTGSIQDMPKHVIYLVFHNKGNSHDQ